MRNAAHMLVACVSTAGMVMSTVGAVAQMPGLVQAGMIAMVWSGGVGLTMWLSDTQSERRARSERLRTQHQEHVAKIREKVKQ